MVFPFCVTKGMVEPDAARRAIAGTETGSGGGASAPDSTADKGVETVTNVSINGRYAKSHANRVDRFFITGAS